MRPRAFSFAFVSSAIFGLVVACGGGAVEGSSSTTPTGPTSPAASATPASTGTSGTAGAPGSSALSAPDASADATLADASSTTTVGSLLGDGGKVCGCSLCAPVVSDDTCKADADCLPEVPCHATRCVGKAHATPRQPGLMCTEIMRCDSTDANSCGCVKGKCTLSPRATR